MLVVVLIAGMLPTIGAARAAEATNGEGRENRVTANAGEPTIIRLPAQDGRVAKADLVAELGRIAGLDLRAVDWLLPDGQLALASPKTERRVATLNRLVGRYAKLRIVRGAAGDEPALEIELRPERMHNDQRFA